MRRWLRHRLLRRGFQRCPMCGAPGIGTNLICRDCYDHCQVDDSELEEFVAETPVTAALDCRVGGCRWGNYRGERCEC